VCAPLLYYSPVQEWPGWYIIEIEMEKVDQGQENVVDFIEYKLMKMLDSFAVGSPDHEAVLAVLELYLSNKVNVKWVEDDVMVTLKDEVDLDLDKLFPESD